MIRLPSFVSIDASNWNMQLISNNRRYENDDGSVQMVPRMTCGLIRQQVKMVICGGCKNLTAFRKFWNELKRGSCSFCFIDPCGDEYAARFVEDLNITATGFMFGPSQEFEVDVVLEMWDAGQP